MSRSYRFLPEICSLTFRFSGVAAAVRPENALPDILIELDGHGWLVSRGRIPADQENIVAHGEEIGDLPSEIEMIAASLLIVRRQIRMLCGRTVKDGDPGEGLIALIGGTLRLLRMRCRCKHKEGSEN